MPYDKIKDLPDSIQKALSTEGQGIFLKAYNSAFKGDQDEEASNKVAWSAVKKAGFKKTTDGSWKKFSETYDLKDIEIFSIGTHNGIKFVENDLDELVKSYVLLKDAIKPRINLGHDRSKWKDGLPALGWITDIKKTGKKVIASFSDVPKIVYEAVKKGLYKRVSAEMYFNYKHEGKIHKRVLSGVAFLGADLPAVKDLADIEAYFYQVDESLFDKVECFDMDATGGVIKSTEVLNMPLTEAQIEKLQKDNDKLKEKNKKLETENFTEKKKGEDREKAIKKEKKDKAMTDFKTFAEDQVKAKKITPAERDKLLENIEENYSNDHGVVFTFDKVKTLIEARPKIQEKEKVKVKGTEFYSDAQVEVDKRAQKFMADNKDATYSEAVVHVLREDEELAEEYGGNPKREG